MRATKRRKHKNRTTVKFKHLNCSPFVAKKRISDKSCITPDIAVRIKEEYNKHHSDSRISSIEPNAILDDLHKHLPTCSSEECFVSQIKDDTLREQVKDALFSPKRPDSWKKNKNEWLSNIDIFEVLRQYEETYPEFEFMGSNYIDFDFKTGDGRCVEDEICKFDLNQHMAKGKTKFGFVFNLAKHNTPGTHWVSLFVDTENKVVFFMDSAGDPIPDEVAALVKRIRKQSKVRLTFDESYPMEHQYGNSECGMYSLYFIITMLTGKTSGGTELNCNKKKIKYFKKHRIPDDHVEYLRGKYFNE